MVLFNYATKELTAKVVYYGPGLCGKTTNLQFIYDTLPNQAKGKMLSLATKTDRTLFFDFLPIDLGTIRGMKTKIQLYTVPGQVFYDTTRKLVLKGADGVVFVADSQAAMADANADSFENLITNLKEQNLDLKDMPHVLQFNKRDMRNAMSVDEMHERLNRYDVPYFEAVATKGDGVFETLKGMSKLVLKHLGRKYGLEEEAVEPVKQPAPPPTEVKGPQLPPNPTPEPTEDQKATAPQEEPEPPKAQASPEQPKAEPKHIPVVPKADPAMEEIEFIEEDLDPIEDDDMDLPPASFSDSIDLDDDSEEIAAHSPKPLSTNVQDELRSLEQENAPRHQRSAPGKEEDLKPISSIDDSEVIELDDVDPLEIDELEDMAEIASMASGTSSNPQEVTPRAIVPPIEVPISVNLPASLEGKPLRLQIDITFED